MARVIASRIKRFCLCGSRQTRRKLFKVTVCTFGHCGRSRGVLVLFPQRVHTSCCNRTHRAFPTSRVLTVDHLFDTARRFSADSNVMKLITSGVPLRATTTTTTLGFVIENYFKITTVTVRRFGPLHRTQHLSIPRRLRHATLIVDTGENERPWSSSWHGKSTGSPARLQMTAGIYV